MDKEDSNKNLTKRLVVDVPEETHQNIKVFCATHKITMQQFLDDAIAFYAEKIRKKGQKS